MKSLTLARSPAYHCFRSLHNTFNTYVLERDNYDEFVKELPKVNIGLAQTIESYTQVRFDFDVKIEGENPYPLFTSNDLNILQKILIKTIKSSLILNHEVYGILLSKPPYVKDGYVKNGIHIHFPQIGMSVEGLKQLYKNVDIALKDANITFKKTDDISKVQWLCYGQSKAPNLKPYLYDYTFDENGIASSFTFKMVRGFMSQTFDVNESNIKDLIPEVVLITNYYAVNESIQLTPFFNYSVFDDIHYETNDEPEIGQDLIDRISYVKNLLLKRDPTEYHDWRAGGCIIKTNLPCEEGFELFCEWSSCGRYDSIDNDERTKQWDTLPQGKRYKLNVAKTQSVCPYLITTGRDVDYATYIHRIVKDKLFTTSLKEGWLYDESTALWKKVDYPQIMNFIYPILEKVIKDSLKVLRGDDSDSKSTASYVDPIKELKKLYKLLEKEKHSYDVKSKKIELKYDLSTPSKMVVECNTKIEGIDAELKIIDASIEELNFDEIKVKFALQEENCKSNTKNKSKLKKLENDLEKLHKKLRVSNSTKSKLETKLSDGNIKLSSKPVIEGEIKSCDIDIAELENEIEGIEADISTLKAFEYSENYHEEIKVEFTSKNEALKNLEKTKKKLIDSKDKFIELLKTNTQKFETLEKEKEEAIESLNEEYDNNIEEIEDKIEQYEKDAKGETDKSFNDTLRITLEEAYHRIGMTKFHATFMTVFSQLIRNDKFEDILNSQITLLPISGNKVVSLVSGEISERKMNHYFTFESGVSIVSDFANGKKAMLDYANGDEELCSNLARLVLYFCSGKTFDRGYYQLLGSGKNGKSSFTMIMKNILGDLCITINKNTIIRDPKHPKDENAPRPEILRMKNMRMCIISETSDGDIVDDYIKKLTGGDMISVRGLFSNKVEEFSMTAKIVICSNEPLQIHTPTPSMLSRTCFIPFDKQFETNGKFMEDIKTKGNRLVSEIFSYCLSEGMKCMQDENLNHCQTVKEFSQCTTKEMDPIGKFIDVACVNEGEIRSIDLFEAFCEFCNNHGMDCMNQKSFGQGLKAKNISKHRKGPGYFYKLSIKKEDRKAEIKEVKIEDRYNPLV